MKDYIRNLSDSDLLDFIRDMQGKDLKLKEQFDFEDHVAELMRRGNLALLLTKLDIVKALNDCDISEDENFYKIEVEQFLKKLGFKST